MLIASELTAGDRFLSSYMSHYGPAIGTVEVVEAIPSDDYMSSGRPAITFRVIWHIEDPDEPLPGVIVLHPQTAVQGA